MTRRRLLEEATAEELAHWQALMLIEGREREAIEKAQTLKAAASDGAADAKRRLKDGRNRHRRN